VLFAFSPARVVFFACGTFKEGEFKITHRPEERFITDDDFESVSSSQFSLVCDSEVRKPRRFSSSSIAIFVVKAYRWNRFYCMDL
jgi:hypothetical protein